jgi:putative tryptophan/tyrosine transport system substrate-binding protein
MFGGTGPGFGFLYVDQIVSLAARHKIPAIYAGRASAVRRGLISYGANLLDSWHQNGVYVDCILRGETGRLAGDAADKG